MRWQSQGSNQKVGRGGINSRIMRVSKSESEGKRGREDEKDEEEKEGR